MKWPEVLFEVDGELISQIARNKAIWQMRIEKYPYCSHLSIGRHFGLKKEAVSKIVWEEHKEYCRIHNIAYRPKGNGAKYTELRIIKHYRENKDL